MCAREDEDGLVCVGEQDLLIDALRPRVQTDESTFAFLNRFDHSASIRQYADIDMVTNCSNISAGPALLQLAAQLTNDRTRTSFNSKETRLGLDDQTFLN
jgi:hypothetical protein